MIVEVEKGCPVEPPPVLSDPKYIEGDEENRCPFFLCFTFPEWVVYLNRVRSLDIWARRTYQQCANQLPPVPLHHALRPVEGFETTPSPSGGQVAPLR